MRSHLVLIAACLLALSGCAKSGSEISGNRAHHSPADVDGARLVAADGEPGNWMATGRTYSDQRFSPLHDINTDNVGQLSLAWYYDLDTHRGQESTPLVIDGVMYVTTAWSRVKALDAATGKLLWQYDPKVPGGWAVNACCDVVNRGAAAWKGKIYVGTLDGRLIALDAKTGKPVWSVQTFDRTKPYTITGAPVIVKGLVLIGNGGSEYDARGYVTAYDAASGKQAWRFYFVPGDPAKGFENDAMKMAAKTWHGEWWKLGGGGSPWNAIVYDPVTDLVYVGTGNGVPWNRAYRSPGGGDNLFIDSIVALKPETGQYVWHYQEVPGDDWDFDSTQPIMTADLPINGAMHHVVMQAPKDGFFYILDATTGQLLSATPFAPMNWATGIDMSTGRPIENPHARDLESGKQFVGEPSPHGAHNWQPWSFDPSTRLVYIPEQEIGFPYQGDPDFKATTKGTNLGLDMEAIEAPIDVKDQEQETAGWKGALIAWDPVLRAPRWRADHEGPWNGGVLATAGNLVVQGLATGQIVIYAADTGEKLWSFDAQTGVMAGPIAYSVNDEEYIAVAAGWGGSYSLVSGELAQSHDAATRNISRILAFKIGGKASLPAPPPLPAMKLDPPPPTTDKTSIARGEDLYERHCNSCHGSSAASGGLVPDLRYSPHLKDDGWYAIVLGGALEANGMANFSDVLNRQDASDIRNYVIERANETLVARGGEAQAPVPPTPAPTPTPSPAPAASALPSAVVLRPPVSSNASVPHKTAAPAPATVTPAKTPSPAPPHKPPVKTVPVQQAAPKPTTMPSVTPASGPAPASTPPPVKPQTAEPSSSITASPLPAPSPSTPAAPETTAAPTTTPATAQPAAQTPPDDTDKAAAPEPASTTPAPTSTLPAPTTPAANAPVNLVPPANGPSLPPSGEPAPSSSSDTTSSPPSDPLVPPVQ